MRTAQFCCLLVLAHTTAFAQQPTSNEALVKLATNLDKLTRVTEQRISLRAAFSDLCAPVDLPDHGRLVGRPDIGIHVYVTPASAAAFKDAGSRFPVGTVVLKQKFPTVRWRAWRAWSGACLQGFVPVTLQDEAAE
jgi:hypothetical protein